MFKNTYQNGFVSVLYAGGSKPLAIWGQVVKNGHIRRVTDEDVQTMALEVMGTNVATTYIVCPADPKNILGIKLPFFVMIVKNMKKYFSFEIQILDDKGMSRRFRVSNYQSATRVRPFSTSLPIGLTGGWNQIQFNLADFTRRAYGSCYLETLRVQIHANVRIRRIYFCDRLYSEDELPADFKLYVPITTQKKGKIGAKGAAAAAGKDVKVLEDKSTGKDERRLSKLSEKSGEKLVQEVPSGALPTPREASIAEMPKMAEKGDGAFEEGVESQPPGQFAEEEAYFDEEEHEEMDFSLAPSAVDDEYIMIETNTEVGEGEGGGEETTRVDPDMSADEGTTDAEAPSTIEEGEKE